MNKLTTTPNKEQDIYDVIKYGNTQQFITWCENNPNILEEDHYFRFAAQQGQVGVFSYLIQQGYDINYNARLAVREAISSGQLVFVDFLYQHPDFRQEPIVDLLSSIKNNHISLVHYFLKKKENLKILDVMFFAAIKNNNLDILTTLIEHNIISPICHLDDLNTSLLTIKHADILIYVMEKELITIEQLMCENYNDKKLEQFLISCFQHKRMRENLEYSLPQQVIISKVKI